MNFTERKRKLLSEIETKKEMTDSGLTYQIFINTPKALKLKKGYEGKRVWIAELPRTTKAFLKEFRGDEVKIEMRGDVNRDFYSTEVILHPSEWRGYI